jgi:hypothetical protein
MNPRKPMAFKVLDMCEQKRIPDTYTYIRMTIHIYVPHLTVTKKYRDLTRVENPRNLRGAS